MKKTEGKSPKSPDWPAHRTIERRPTEAEADPDRKRPVLQLVRPARCEARPVEAIVPPGGTFSQRSSGTDATARRGCRRQEKCRRPSRPAPGAPATRPIRKRAGRSAEKYHSQDDCVEKVERRRRSRDLPRVGDRFEVGRAVHIAATPREGRPELRLTRHGSAPTKARDPPGGRRSARRRQAHPGMGSLRISYSIGFTPAWRPGDIDCRNSRAN